ncbi:hypothetical protein [Oryza sativa Japonica Group]|uniref:Uncharacterized protein n=1 Tax=Oryza sativa subsp. japonica TaxID=39947 RepID=Q5NB87_ORYSJ|nr:hypothetical protein [Oryza sativa Japonica Group]
MPVVCGREIRVALAGAAVGASGGPVPVNEAASGSAAATAGDGRSGDGGPSGDGIRNTAEEFAVAEMPQPPPSVRTRSVTSVALPTHGDGGGCRLVPLSPFDAYWVALLPVHHVFLFPSPPPPPPPPYSLVGVLVYSPEEEEEEEGSLSIVIVATGMRHSSLLGVSHPFSSSSIAATSSPCSISTSIKLLSPGLSTPEAIAAAASTRREPSLDLEEEEMAKDGEGGRRDKGG